MSSEENIIQKNTVPEINTDSISFEATQRSIFFFYSQLFWIFNSLICMLHSFIGKRFTDHHEARKSIKNNTWTMVNICSLYIIKVAADITIAVTKRVGWKGKGE